MKPKCECEHEFTLVLTGVTTLTREVEDALFEAGCDDATLAMRCGRPFITFARTAESLKDAILTAIRQVRNAGRIAGISVDVLRVDSSNLVTQADIGRKIGRTRQLVHQYMTGRRGPGGFPGPVCEIGEGTFLWLWCEVAYWLRENDMIKDDVLRDAEEVDVINGALEVIRQRRMNRTLADEVMQFVSS